MNKRISRSNRARAKKKKMRGLASRDVRTLLHRSAIDAMLTAGQSEKACTFYVKITWTTWYTQSVAAENATPRPQLLTTLSPVIKRTIIFPDCG